MTPEELKQVIIKKSKEIGIDKIGFCQADSFSHLKESLQTQIKKGNVTGFEYKNLEERLYPKKIFQEPKTIISICLAYPTKSKIPFKQGRVKRGQFSRSSWGLDYHVILQEKLQELREFIQKEVSEKKPDFLPMVDTGALVDVAVAQRAGLGFIGKNGLLITKEFGSFVYLGEMITNLEIPVDVPVRYDCGDCTRCIKFCPTKALVGNGKMQVRECLSFQTQKKGKIEEKYRKKMKTVIYGCDICQNVCPYNKGKDFHFHEEMEPDYEVVFPELQPLLTISNKEFQERFGKLAGSWRGKKIIQRNAIIALANANDHSALPLLKKIVETDSREEIVETALWAIATLSSEGLFEE